MFPNNILGKLALTLSDLLEDHFMICSFQVSSKLLRKCFCNFSGIFFVIFSELSRTSRMILSYSCSNIFIKITTVVALRFCGNDSWKVVTKFEQGSLIIFSGSFEKDYWFLSVMISQIIMFTLFQTFHEMFLQFCENIFCHDFVAVWKIMKNIDIFL